MASEERVYVAACETSRVKVSVGCESEDFVALLICQQCRVVAEIKMRSPIPKAFQARCRCNAIYVGPNDDGDEGRLVFTGLDCLKSGTARVN